MAQTGGAEPPILCQCDGQTALSIVENHTGTFEPQEVIACWKARSQGDPDDMYPGGVLGVMLEKMDPVARRETMDAIARDGMPLDAGADLGGQLAWSGLRELIKDAPFAFVEQVVTLTVPQDPEAASRLARTYLESATRGKGEQDALVNALTGRGRHLGSLSYAKGLAPEVRERIWAESVTEGSMDEEEAEARITQWLNALVTGSEDVFRTGAIEIAREQPALMVDLICRQEGMNQEIVENLPPQCVVYLLASAEQEVRVKATAIASAWQEIALSREPAKETAGADWPDVLELREEGARKKQARRRRTIRERKQDAETMGRSYLAP